MMREKSDLPSALTDIQARQQPRSRRNVCAVVALAVLWGPTCIAGEGDKVVPIAAWQQLLSLQSIEVKAEKDDRAQAIIFFDPNCPVCAKLWGRLYAKNSPYKGLSTRWIPVAYFNGQSIGKAANLLSSNSVPMLAKNFVDFDFERRQGAVAESAVSLEIRSQVRRGQLHWEKLGGATPLIVYRTKDGGVRAQVGLLPEPQFSNMVQSMMDTRLTEFK